MTERPSRKCSIVAALALDLTGNNFQGWVMRIDEHVRNHVVVVEPRGGLTVETEADFTGAVRRLLTAGHSRLVLNLAHVPRIDSCGLGAIAQAYVSVWSRGGMLKLLHVSARNLQLLAVTKLSTVFEIFDSEEAAERSFGAPALCLVGDEETGGALDVRFGRQEVFLERR